jgi:hypothetical protein
LTSLQVMEADMDTFEAVGVGVLSPDQKLLMH